MEGGAGPGWRVLGSHLALQRRKLKWTWEVAFTDQNEPILVNTQRPNALVAEALAEARIPALAGYTEHRPEVRIGEDKSRIDFVLSGHPTKPDCYLEVKSVSWAVEDDLGAFPDAVTKRGQKHLRELMAQRNAGHRAAMLFVLSHSRPTRIRPAREVDPDYAALLAQASAAGVELLGRKVVFSTGALQLGAAAPIVLSGSTGGADR